MRTVLIFDLGGILEIHDIDSFCNWIKNKYSIYEDIKPIYKKWEYLRDVDKIDEHEFYQKFIDEIKISLSEEEFYQEYYTNHVHQCLDMLKFIENKLFGKYELYIFSNNSKINIRKFQDKINYEKLFKKCVYSFDLKTKKPALEFFKKGLKIINHKGDECIFIDDQLKSKINSEKLGIKFIQYINLDKLKLDLKSLNILP